MGRVDPRLDLKSEIRPKLISLENTIIFNLLARAQYAENGVIYSPGGIKIPGFEGSFLDFLLEKEEAIYASVGCYANPREHAFSERLPNIIATMETEENPIPIEGINLNREVRKIYLEIIKKICEPGDDKQRGSATIHDIRCLQALSKRVHLGIYVAESKFQADSEGYQKLIDSKDREGLGEKLTKKDFQKCEEISNEFKKTN